MSYRPSSRTSTPGRNTPVGGASQQHQQYRGQSGGGYNNYGSGSGGGAASHHSSSAHAHGASGSVNNAPTAYNTSRSHTSVASEVEAASWMIHAERESRNDTERRLLEFEHSAAAERIESDEGHRRRLLEMFLVAGHLHEDRKSEATRELKGVENSCTPSVQEQLKKVAHHTEVERSVVESLRRQLEARLSKQRAEASKEREKVQFYRTMLIRRMRALEGHVKMLYGPEHWLLRLPDLADREKPFTSVSGYAVQSSPAAKQFDISHHHHDDQHRDGNSPAPGVPAAAAAAATSMTPQYAAADSAPHNVSRAVEI